MLSLIRIAARFAVARTMELLEKNDCINNLLCNASLGRAAASSQCKTLCLTDVSLMAPQIERLNSPVNVNTRIRIEMIDMNKRRISD
jgi:hypothetical protein